MDFGPKAGAIVQFCHVTHNVWNKEKNIIDAVLASRCGLENWVRKDLIQGSSPSVTHWSCAKATLAFCWEICSVKPLFTLWDTPAWILGIEWNNSTNINLKYVSMCYAGFSYLHSDTQYFTILMIFMKEMLHLWNSRYVIHYMKEEAQYEKLDFKMPQVEVTEWKPEFPLIWRWAFQWCSWP